jgi:hypothetical protein
MGFSVNTHRMLTVSDGEIFQSKNYKLYYLCLYSVTFAVITFTATGKG